MSQRFVLGTVQLGLSYGVANNNGQVSVEESKKIIHLAKKSGIKKLDTAISYGKSENLLGHLCDDSWDIITKLPEAPTEIDNINRWAKHQIKKSLHRLGVSKLYAVMLHTTSVLSSNNSNEYWNTLQELKQEGLIQTIG